MTTVRCETQDLNLSRLFCYAEARGIAFYDVTPARGKTTFRVAKKQLANLLEICGKLCYTITVVEEIGFGGFLGQAKRRFGIALGILAGLCAAATVYSKLWFVEIDASAVFAPVVASDLVGMGVRPGVSKRGVDRAELVRALESIEGVGSAQVRMRGCRLLVTLRETELADTPVEREEGAAIVARYDCKIESLSVVAGTAKVGPGDIVTRGQVLVEGVEGEGAERREVVPRACVYGEVWFTASDLFREHDVERVRTGAWVRRAQMKLGSLQLWSVQPSVPFALAESETRLSKPGCGVLPLTLTETIWYELTEREIVRDFVAERETLEAAVIDRAMAKVAKDCAFLESYSVATRESDAIRITGVVRTRAVVSV